MKWTKEIEHLFGLADRNFAEHPSDEERAFELLGRLRGMDIGWPTFEYELRRCLAKMPKLDTDEQVEKVRPLFQPWLLD